MLIDTHCHLDSRDFDKDRYQVIAKAKEAGVAAVINVGSSIEASRRAVELAKAVDIVYAALGIHPHEADTVNERVIAEFRSLAKNDKVVAIGEVGLDFYRNLSPKDAQIAAFKKFIELSIELDLPLIIHSRDAHNDTIDILKEYERRMRGVMHCFSGDEAFLKECLDLGLFVSFAGNLTFKKAEDLRSVARHVPVERLLLETDAPFLAPQALRGKRNEPAYLEYLVDEWARLTGLSVSDIARITTHNANELFRLELPVKAKIVYEIRGSLYINMTNRCTNDCGFCIRSRTDFVKGHLLSLDREPSSKEIIEAIGDPKKYNEIAFCGYGEPTMRLDDLKAIAGYIKANGGMVRLVTNGHGDIINSRPIAKELSGLVDKVSVSLNADTEEKYGEICLPKFGSGTFGRVRDFIKDCVTSGIEAEVTCLDLPGVDRKKCEAIALGLGAKFRLRRYGVTG